MKMLEWFKKKKECEHYWAVNEKNNNRRSCIFCGKVQILKINRWMDV